MILYNITVIIEEDIEGEWLLWMQNTYIPEVMQAGMFVSQRLLKVLESPNEGVTYCIQYVAESKTIYDSYRLQFEPGFMETLHSRYPNKLVSFSTIMEYI